MQISTKDWKNYITKLSNINKIAGAKMQDYVARNGFKDRQALIDYAHALVTKYGEASSELACQMYEAIAEMEGKIIDAAIPAKTATYQETAKAVNGSLLQSPTGQKLSQVAERLVKQVGQDTTMQNALRDGAFFAWVPSGDTCAFCLTLASNGFQRASKKAIKGGHAEHIHANCDCAYCISFDPFAEVEGYNPEELKRLYDSQDGKPNDKINAIRRLEYAKNKDIINAQKREAYYKKAERVLPTSLSFVYNGIERFIPQGTLVAHPITIAGKGAKKEFRDANKYVKAYGGEPSDWRKRVGKIESNMFIFDIHWCEDKNGTIYDLKIKDYKEK